MVKVYAYFLELTGEIGIVDTWSACQEKIKGVKARYKSFSNQEEAKLWLQQGANYKKKIPKGKQDTLLEEAIYFDAGTGRGRGVEVRVTNRSGESLLDCLLTDSFQNFLNRNLWVLNEFGNIELGKKKTNNFGELLALYFAIECAKKCQMLKIFGDSKLVLEYWSKGKYHPENIGEDTVNLIKRVILQRKEFENKGGCIQYISGDINPADLGFHKG